MDPIKCPECGTWWRGDEHRCPPMALRVLTDLGRTPEATTTDHRAAVDVTLTMNPGSHLARQIADNIVRFTRLSPPDEEGPEGLAGVPARV